MARPFCCQFSVDLMDVYEYQMEQKKFKILQLEIER